MRLLILIIVILLLVGALPTWPYSAGWGYYPSGGLGLLVVVLVIGLLVGCSCRPGDSGPALTPRPFPRKLLRLVNPARTCGRKRWPKTILFFTSAPTASRRSR
ncbi:MAG: DUF3309 domain-containing protein [Stellaceae bacterium]